MLSAFEIMLLVVEGATIDVIVTGSFFICCNGVNDSDSDDSRETSEEEDALKRP